MIKILDSFIADKIAAGEVIERPVSAVKELIENSIDAGAASIIAEIRGGGSSYIRITDDGCGISSDEIETAFLRHATSKIESIADLDNIKTLGFRGEALASISAVSRLTIISRSEADSYGTKLIMHAGKIISKEKTGANKGTTIVVEDLFYNTPARRKYLKSDAREASAVTELVQQYASCYSGIRFMMINNGETLFTTPGDGNTESAIKSLYPVNSHRSLIPVSGEGVSGFISGPGTTIGSRKGQHFYVNGRLVSSGIIEKALTDGYDGRIFSGFPVAILFIDEDPHAIDVNIHPGKKEILFLHPDDLSRRIKSAVSTALDSGASIPQPARYISSESVYGDSISNYNTSDIEATPEGEYTVAETPTIREYLGSIERNYSDTINIPEPDTEAEAESERNGAKFDFEDLHLKGYVFDTYIIMESGETLYVFDQHAAHERIYYEKFISTYNSDKRLLQPILSPIMINLSADVYALRDDIISALSSLGYDISDFGSGSLIIRAIPSFMSAAEAEIFANSFCSSEDIGEVSNGTVTDKLIMKSCKSAVKGGDRLSEAEISDLLSELAECSNPYSCPHGRPTFIKITKYDAERAFKRK